MRLRCPGSITLLAVVSLSVPAGRAQAPQQRTPPVFRSGVDVVTVDVVVLDREGRQVTDLGPADFAVVAAGRERRLLSAEYVPGRPAADAPPIAPAGAPVPEPSSNAAPQSGRNFLFVVDADGIRSGEGGVAMGSIGEYLDRLDPRDRVGLVVIPYGRPQIELTTDHDSVREASQRVYGASQDVREMSMTYGEAVGIQAGDTKALLAYARRAPGGLLNPRVGESDCVPGGGLLVEESAEVPRACQIVAERALTRHGRRTRDVVDVLRALAERMTDLDGQKTIILVSEGLLSNFDTLPDLKRFADAAERARVALYALHLDAPLTEAVMGSASNAMESRRLDDVVGFDGMADIAVAARGTALRVIGPATNALARIDEELAGHYLLSFEREPVDRDGARAGITVKVDRPGLDVRARREFTPQPRAAATAGAAALTDAKIAMVDLLTWPANRREIALSLDTFVVPVASQSREARVVIAAEITAAGAPIAAVGYEISSAGSGQGAADTFDAPPILRPIPGQRELYVAAVPLPPGRYRLRLGAIDDAGARGSVEHVFELADWPAAGPRVGDLVLGADGASGFRPVASVGSEIDELVARVEIHADAPADLEGLTASLTIDAVAVGPTIPSPPVTLAAVGDDPRRRAAVARITPRDLPPGRHVVTIVISSGGVEVARRSRALSQPGSFAPDS